MYKYAFVQKNCTNVSLNLRGCCHENIHRGRCAGASDPVWKLEKLMLDVPHVNEEKKIWIDR